MDNVVLLLNAAELLETMAIALLELSDVHFGLSSFLSSLGRLVGEDWLVRAGPIDVNWYVTYVKF